MASVSNERLRQRPRFLDQVGECVFVQCGIERIERIDEDTLQPARRRDPAGMRVARKADDDRRIALARAYDLAEPDLFRR